MSPVLLSKQTAFSATLIASAIACQDNDQKKVKQSSLSVFASENAKFTYAWICSRHCSSILVCPRRALCKFVYFLPFFPEDESGLTLSFRLAPCLLLVLSELMLVCLPPFLRPFCSLASFLSRALCSCSGSAEHIRLTISNCYSSPQMVRVHSTWVVRYIC